MSEYVRDTQRTLKSVDEGLGELLQERPLASLTNPLGGAVVEDVVGVAFDAFSFSVDVQLGIEVGSLPFEADPMVESRPRLSLS